MSGQIWVCTLTPELFNKSTCMQSFHDYQFLSTNRTALFWVTRTAVKREAYGGTAGGLRWLWADPGRRKVCRCRSAGRWCCPGSPHKRHRWPRRWPGTQPCQSGTCWSGCCSYNLKPKQTGGVSHHGNAVLWPHCYLHLTQGYWLLVWFQCPARLFPGLVCYSWGKKLEFSDRTVS